MNRFCQCLLDSIFRKFRIEAEFFVSKKKKNAHIAFEKPLLAYSYFDEIVSSIEQYWLRRKLFFPGYCFVYPRMNQSLKLKNGYIFLLKDTTKKMQK